MYRLVRSKSLALPCRLFARESRNETFFRENVSLVVDRQKFQFTATCRAIATTHHPNFYQKDPPCRHHSPHHHQPQRTMTTNLTDVPFEGVSEEVSKIISEHANQPQTSVSLQALMRTGRGEFLHRTFDHVDENGSHEDTHSATELVLIQVCKETVCPIYTLFDCRSPVSMHWDCLANISYMFILHVLVSFGIFLSTIR